MREAIDDAPQRNRTPKLFNQRTVLPRRKQEEMSYLGVHRGTIEQNLDVIVQVSSAERGFLEAFYGGLKSVQWSGRAAHANELVCTGIRLELVRVNDGDISEIQAGYSIQATSIHALTQHLIPFVTNNSIYLWVLDKSLVATMFCQVQPSVRSNSGCFIC